MNELYIYSLVSFVVGLGAGAVIMQLIKGKPAPAAAPQMDTEAAEDWWAKRKTLSGTQLQILQFIENAHSVSISKLQDKFKAVPDRELFYRLEQICLMGFVGKQRADGEVRYVMTEEYEEAVDMMQDDKTVMIVPD